MKSKIIVIGATGNLGARIVRSLTALGAEVVAIVRKETDEGKIDELSKSGAKVIRLDLSDTGALAAAFAEASCVVSALAGLRNVIVETQTLILKAALAAGVNRFIPSDFCTDYNELLGGANRNFDLRKEFKKILDAAPIQSTSIFNGAFAEVLQYNMPFLDRKKHTIGYVADPDHKVEFTTMDNTAKFTAAAALDSESPRFLRIASFQVSAKEMAAMASEVYGAPFELQPMGTLAGLAEKNKQDRAADPAGEEQLYPRWQQSQYLYSMFSVSVEALDNDRYPGIGWTAVTEFLKTLK